MTTDVLLALMACGLYAGAAALAIAHMHIPSRARGRDMIILAALAALCLVAMLVLRAAETGRFPVFAPLEAAGWYGLAVTAAYLYVALRHEVLRTVSAVVLSLVAAVLLLGLHRGEKIPAAALAIRSNALGVHVTAAFTGYGLFTLVALLGAAYLVQDWNLKRKHLGPLAARLPSLETLDRVMVELIGVAFVLFSISIGLGIFLAHVNRWGMSWMTDPKVLTTGVTWLIYAALFSLCRSGRHGRRVAVVAVLGFAGVLLAFMGIHLVAHSVHSFGFESP